MYLEGPESIFGHEGKRFKVDDLLAYVEGEKQRRIPLSSLRPLENNLDPSRVAKSDLNAPIIVLQDTPWGNIVADGAHRVTKALSLDRKTLPGKLVKEKDVLRDVPYKLTKKAGLRHKMKEFLQHIRGNIATIKNPGSPRQTLDAAAKLGIPLGAQTYHYIDSSLPSDKAYSAAGGVGSVGMNVLLWRQPVWAQIAGQTGMYAGTKLATKLALQDRDAVLRQRIAREIVRDDPHYKGLLTRIRNLQEELPA